MDIRNLADIGSLIDIGSSAEVEGLINIKSCSASLCIFMLGFKP